jgi:hypothetical protein
MFPSYFSIKSIYYYEGNTNYTQPLQQCSALEQYGCTQPKKKRITKKEKPRYSDKFLVAATLTPPRKHQKSNISKRDASKEETVHKHRHHPITDLRFSPSRKVRAHKTMPLTRLLPGTTN